MGSLDENPKCARTYASFRLIGDTQVIADIGTRTGLSSDGVNEARRKTVWWISSENRIETTSLERHLRLLLDIVEPRSDALIPLIETGEVSADFFCLWRSADGDGGPEVSPETLARIAALDAALGLDFYSDADGD